jgi:hypothetical protein
MYEKANKSSSKQGIPYQGVSKGAEECKRYSRKQISRNEEMSKRGPLWCSETRREFELSKSNTFNGGTLGAKMRRAKKEINRATEFSSGACPSSVGNFVR